jgi:hypothetical protein
LPGRELDGFVARCGRSDDDCVGSDTCRVLRNERFQLGCAGGCGIATQTACQVGSRWIEFYPEHTAACCFGQLNCDQPKKAKTDDGNCFAQVYFGEAEPMHGDSTERGESGFVEGDLASFSLVRNSCD